MSKTEKKEKPTATEQINPEDRFSAGDGNPSCEGSSCVNMAEDEDNSSPASETDTLRAEAEQWKDKYMRLSAEFDNYRKRTLREKMDLIASGGEDIIKAMLDVADDMDRAVAATIVSPDAESVRRGVELISQKLYETLRSRGVSEIEAMGCPLDTDLHEAVAKIPAPESSGLIVDVVQKGYKLKDKVIRYAKVVVGE